MRSTPSLKARALRYLSTREYSRKELSEKLFQYVQSDDDLDALLAWLEGQGFLSDSRFAEVLVFRKMGRYGNNRIAQELRQHQIKDDLYDATMQLLVQNEVDRAYAVWKKKFGRWSMEVKEQARQKRFLQQRGFSLRTIHEVMAVAKNERETS